MNIIFGRENAEAMSQKHTMLELDTFRISGEHLITAFCAVDGVAILDMPKIESMKNLHANLLENYRKGDWNYCEQAMEHLVGFWNGNLDTFYDSIKQRIEQHRDETLTEGWWIVDKPIVG